MEYEILFSIALIFAVLFLVSNSSNDSSSVIASLVASKAASPVQAVVLAAVCEFLGALSGAGGVALSMASIVKENTAPVMTTVVCAALIAAFCWNMITARLGLPSSSTHALVGALTGAMVCAAGVSGVNWGIADLFRFRIDGVLKVIAGLIVSPLAGIAAAYVVQKAAALILRSASNGISSAIGSCQWMFTAMLAYNHGANDSQKITGIFLLLVTAHCAQHNLTHLTISLIPLWLRLIVALFMGIGVLVGGWSIIRTLGSNVCFMSKLNAFNSEAVSVGVLALSNVCGVPVSATQVIAGSVVGVGAAESTRGVNWQIGGEIMISWIVTMPFTAVLGASLFALVNVL